MRKNLVFALLVLCAIAAPAFSQPAAPAPTPTAPADSVISLFSNAYTNVTVDTWSADWDQADVSDIQIAGDDVKLYENLVFAGIEFGSQPVDATEMNRFHMDIWTPDETASPAQFRVKLVDYGADGAYGGGDDVEQELTFTATTTPGLETGAWVAIDVPLSDFTNLTTRAALAQMVISGDLGTVYVDNIYFYNGTVVPPVEPTEAAPTPTADAADVISLYSNAYTNVPVDTWSAEWDQADVTDVQVAGDDVKKYTNMVFAGIEFGSNPIDATGMTRFHMDIWTPNETADPAQFKVKLVDYGADGMYGGGDDVEHELTFTANSTPGLESETWVAIDVPLSDFANLTTRGALAQMVLSGTLNTVYVDNVYFYNGTVEPPAEPTTPAPTPTADASDVTSLFSDVYTNVNVDTWSADWDQADVTDFQIGEDNVKKYSYLVYAGIDFGSNPVDASGMDNFHMDIWTPDGTDLPAMFKIKLVDYGPDGVYGGDDDSESEVTFDAESGLATEQWVSFDIPMADFSGLTNTTAIAQMVLSGDLSTVYVDNVYFYMESSDVAERTALPSDFALTSIYPNPFNPTTNVVLALPQTAKVHVAVYNSLGQQVAVLVSNTLSAGSHTLTFDGSRLASGLYIVRATVNGSPLATKRMILMK